MKKTRIWMAMGAVALVLTAVACGKKSSDNNSNVSSAQGLNGNIAAGNSNLPNQMYSRQAAYIGSDNADQFNTDAKALAATSVDPKYVGTVNNLSGVLIQGDVYIDRATGNMIGIGSTAIQIDIRDSYVVEQGADPISIFIRGTQGRAAGGQASLQFADNYGTITINGTYNASTFTGTVSYQNTTGSYNGRSSGTLGRFTVPTCGFFHCQ